MMIDKRVLFTYVTAGVSAVLVNIDQGTLRGSTVNGPRGKLVDEYLGVPYAQPPDGRRRFRPPEPANGWSGEFDATGPPRSCYSSKDEVFGDFDGADMWNPKTPLSEDCLNLNIWVPHGEKDGTVMLWIFGGGFFSGSPSLDLYNGTALAADRQVIVVNINYRLGAFGFLYLGQNSDAPGNMGLLDQQLALKWVNNNIHRFGGDPRKVTLFGESAGSASVSSHLFAPGSRGLFKNLILQSGCIINPWAHVSQAEAIKRGKSLARKLHCDNAEPRVVVECLQKKTSAEIQAAANKITAPEMRFMEFPFVPVDNDGHYFTSPLQKAIDAGEMAKVPILLGTVANEGTYWLPYFVTNTPFYEDKAKSHPDNQALVNYTQYEDSIQQMLDGRAPKLLRDGVAFQYLEGKTDPQHLRFALGQVLGDYWFTCDLLLCANYFDKAQINVYQYYFTHRTKSNPWPDWMGTMHGYEVDYAFGRPLAKLEKYTNAEIELSKRVMNIWTEFARNGNPTGGLSVLDTWPRYHADTQEYVEIGVQSDKVKETTGSKLQSDECSMLRIVNQYGNDPPSSHNRQCSPMTSSRPATFLSGFTVTIAVFISTVLVFYRIH